ncbi:MAG: M23 family metallopeptidase [Clostridiaceae bacterium]|nr:M23 family metallopeptidase [Clostridiaceae bacterium]
MESTYRKRNYARHGFGMDWRKNKGKEDFVENVVKQILACCIIFLILFVIKSINLPATNMIANKIRSTLSYTVDWKNSYKSVTAFARNLNSINEKIFGSKNNKQEVNNDTKTDATKQDTGTNEQGTDNTEPVTDPTEIIEKGYVRINQEIAAPLDGIITSTFGMRQHPLLKKDEYHYGIDIDGKKGMDITAAMDGEVLETGYNDSYGKYVRLKHEEDLITFYAHCSEILVNKGEKVKLGTPIAKVGGSGTASGEHLHFEIWKGDKVLDPLKYIQLPLDPNMPD